MNFTLLAIDEQLRIKAAQYYISFYIGILHVLALHTAKC